MAPLLGCGNADTRVDSGVAYALASVVIDADGGRTTYVQTIDSLDAGPFNNDSALEVPGNGVLLAGGGHFFVGLAEEPSWIRYSVVDDRRIEETGRLSLLNLGANRIDYGNVIVDESTAVSVLSRQAIAVVWNPTTMEIRGEIDISHLLQPDYELEVWTTISHNGLVYIPGRWANWTAGQIRPGVSVTIIDPQALSVVAVAEDDRCASGGRVVFDEAGYGYVMGDGRTYSAQMFANAAGTPPPDNCLLRIPPGGTDFEADFFHTIPSLTGGLQSITELETSQQGSGLAFSKMFYPDKLPDDIQPIDFAFWDHPAHKMWRLELGDPPTAQPVGGIPFSAVGFPGSELEGQLYSG